MSSHINIRALATEVLVEVLSKQQALTQVLPPFKAQCHDPQNAAFLQALCFGVLRTYPRLCFIANQLLKTPLKQKEIELLYLICVGLYQLIELRTPPHAAISETVEATRILKKPWATGLVNAVLRGYQRQAETLLYQATLNLEAKTAHPLWLIEHLKKAWPNEFESILSANNQLPPLILRINLQKTTCDSYREILTSNGIINHPCLGISSGILLESPVDITQLPGFSEGLFSVQDGAAQLAPQFLEFAPGLRVLDACAAPGGKTTHILEVEPGLAEVVALDISRTRTDTLIENLTRLQQKATVLTGDAARPNTWWDGQLFDRILLDAPCSSVGVIRRHPDIKFLRHAAEIAEFAQKQYALLTAMWPLLHCEGILVYVTCSILPEENEAIMTQFLKNHEDASSIPLKAEWGRALPHGLQLLPGENGMDGFYYAAIRKIKRVL